MVTNKLRIEKFRCLEINRAILSPKLGCGLVLQKIPKVNLNMAMEKALAAYKINKYFADKPAAKFIQDEKYIKQFYANVQSAMLLSENFQKTFDKIPIIMVYDYSQESAWFIGDVEGRLVFTNYYRDIMPNILKEFKVGLVGSYARLLPLGWQNLYDVIDAEFVKSNPAVKTIEILSVITDARFRNSVLSIGINLLNLGTPETIKEKIQEVITRKINEH